MEVETSSRPARVPRPEALAYPRWLRDGEPCNAKHSYLRHKKVVIVLPQETNALVSPWGISYIAGHLHRPLQRDQNQNPWTELIPTCETFREKRKSRNQGRCYRKEAIVAWRRLEAADHGLLSS